MGQEEEMDVEEETHIVEVEGNEGEKKVESKEDEVEVVTEEIEVDIHDENEELDYGEDTNENEVAKKPTPRKKRSNKEQTELKEKEEKSKKEVKKSEKRPPLRRNIQESAENVTVATRKRNWGKCKVNVDADLFFFNVNTDSLKELVELEEGAISKDTLDLDEIIAEEDASNEHEEGEISESEKEDDEDAMETETYGPSGDVRNPKKTWKGKKMEETSDGEVQSDSGSPMKKKTKLSDNRIVVDGRKVESKDDRGDRTFDKMMSYEEVGEIPDEKSDDEGFYVHVQNLVRPFAISQLKQLLSEQGEYVEESFCIDRIKSNCFVRYEKKEIADSTIKTLQNLQWPTSSPKRLQVNFISQSDREILKSGGKLVDKREIARRERHRVRDDRRGDGDRSLERRRKSFEEKREWDNNKRNMEDDRRRRRSRSPRRAEGDRSRSRRSPPPESKSLDDLFKKTKSQPCIYWLPCTEDDIERREKEREEREKRREEKRKEVEKKEEEEMKKRRGV